jgi:methylase of polypeptide subunit release factors
VDEELRPLDAVDAQNAAIAWAKQAVVLAGLVRKQAKREPDTEYESYVESEAKKLIARRSDGRYMVVSVGEFYLVRAGNTRKGTGTFHTPPQLAVPTVHRTLEPLCYDKQPGSTLVPKKPEVILKLKVCDPACGSASLLVASLHYITEALYRSLCHHCHLDDPAHAMKVTLPFGRPRSKPNDEIVPFPPNDPQRGDGFADRVKARLRRHVVERCIYGVDINPLAVELARVSLWVETLDRELPFSFLDHKIKVGNSLVGCWLDRVLDYPLKAWERNGGDDPDSKTDGPRTQRIETFLKGEKKGNGRRSGDGIIKQEMRELIEGRFQKQPGLFVDMTSSAKQVVAGVRIDYELLHELSVADPDQREQFYKDRIENSQPLQNLKRALDEWCAIWFWPADEQSLHNVTTPLTFHRSTPQRERIIESLASQLRFFHWELAFPDVFTSDRTGFDAVVGNPPWEVMKPNSHEFFTEYDPLYRTYDKQAGLDRQEEISSSIPGVAERWDDYNGAFKALSNWCGGVAEPFDVPLARGKQQEQLASAWAKVRQKRVGFAPPDKPFRSQGSADLNSFKLFLELAYRLLTPAGRLGFIVPSGLYTDKGTRDLRELFLDQATWNWLFSFENKKRIFAIHGSFKFGAVIVDRRRTGQPLYTAFMVHDLADWERTSPPAFPVDRELIALFSPRSRSIPEIISERDLSVCKRVFENSTRIGDQSADLAFAFTREFHMTDDSRLFPPLLKWETQGFVPDPFGRWVGPAGRLALPLYQGTMIQQFDCIYQGWEIGLGRSAKWKTQPQDAKQVRPKFLIDQDVLRESGKFVPGCKLLIRAIARTTDERTMIPAVVRDVGSGHSVNTIRIAGGSVTQQLTLAGMLSSLIFDYCLRQRMGGTNLSWYILDECALPSVLWRIKREPTAAPLRIALGTARMTFVHRMFAVNWLNNSAEYRK